MGIPDSQLQTWAKQGATAQLSDTQRAIKDAIGAFPNFRGGAPEVYLQGSYKNDTNVYADSDVDVVVQSPVFQWNKEELNLSDQTLVDQRFPDSQVTFSEFRADVISALERFFGRGSVSPDNKCIRLLSSGNRKAADVIPCLRYRRFQSGAMDKPVEGMAFFTMNDSRKVINYPKVHYDNGVEKHAATSSNYKPAIRMFKNARNTMVDQRRLQTDVAPSYFIECLLYNIPPANFVASRSDTFYNVLRVLTDQNLDLAKFGCQNWQTYLFGDTGEQWRIEKAQAYIAAMVNLWNNWGK